MSGVTKKVKKATLDRLIKQRIKIAFFLWMCLFIVFPRKLIGLGVGVLDFLLLHPSSFFLF